MVKYLAKINNNIVENTVIFEDEDFAKGIDHCKNLIGDTEGTYIECTKGVSGDHYDPNSNVFYPQKPHESWILNSEFEWEAPVTKPDKGSNVLVTWNESNLRWEAFSEALEAADKYWDTETSTWLDI